MLNIQTQRKFKYAHQQILFFKLLFNVKLIYSIQVLGPWLWGNRPFFSSVVGQRKGPSGANVPPVHGIKKCLDTDSTDVLQVVCTTCYQCWKMSGSTRNFLTKSLRRKFLTSCRKFLSAYNIINVYESVLQVEIVLCRDEVYHNVRHHTFSEIYICRKFCI